MKKFLTVLLVIAVMFTFSFGSAFAALQYEGETTISKPVAEKTDFYGYDSTTAKTQGTFGISTVQQKSEAIGLENAKDNEEDKYPAGLQAKVDAAYDTAIAAVKAAKTSKEMELAKETLEATLEKLDLAANTYAALKTAATWRANAKFTVGDIDEATEYYMVPGYGLITATNGVVNAGMTPVFNWLMDQGYYGYTSNTTWEDVLTNSKEVRNAVINWLEPYYIGTTPLVNVYKGTTMASTLEKYGRTVYAEYADAVATFKEYLDKKTTTIEEFVAVMDKIAAFEDKYGFDDTVAIDPLTDANLDGNKADAYAFDGDIKILVAADKWYIANLGDAIDKISKINTVAGYTAAKADIIAAAKVVVDVVDKYSDYEDKDTPAATLADKMLAGEGETVFNALKTIMKEETVALDKVCKEGAYTENVPVTGTTTATFDSSEANLAAIAAARTAFDAYLADYIFVYEAVANGVEVGSAAGIVTVGELKEYEFKLLAAEYNKTAVPAKADEVNAEEAAKIQAFLNNATLKVTTTALGNNKIRVQAKVDAETYRDLVTYLGDDYTISYKFYHKTAAAKTYKAAKEKDRNYITYTKISLKKGVKYKFRCALIVKNADGKVVATKSYKASTVGSRVCR